MRRITRNLIRNTGGKMLTFNLKKEWFEKIKSGEKTHEYILTNPHCQIQFLKKGYKFLNKDGEEMGIFKNPLALVYFMPVALPNRLFT